MKSAALFGLLCGAVSLACGGSGDRPVADAGPDVLDGSVDASDGAGDGADSPRVCEPGFFGPDCRPCDCEGGATCDDGVQGSGACSCAGGFAWTEHPDNPVIAWQDFLPNMFWNDPSVISQAASFRMWLSGGDPTQDPISVSVYQAFSADGVVWDLDTSPVLTPGAAPAWDSERVETPDVVLVDGTYHMYYSGCGAGCGLDPVWAIGHATSPDGVAWTRDPENPVLTRQEADPSAWGAVGANEPAVLVDPADGTFYLYYASVRFDEVEPTTAHIGILLATSPDGSHFTHVTDPAGGRRLILTRDIPGATPGSWFGYANPGALLDASGRIHLLCGFVVAPGGPATARTVAIDHAASDDGLDFTVVDEALFEAGTGDWKDQNVRAATGVEERGSLEIWFAGDTQTPAFSEGIGLANGICD